MNPPGVFKKRRGKRDLGEKFDSKFYPSNYKKDVIYKNYEDLLDGLYMENKGIDYQLRSYKNKEKKEEQNYNNNKNEANQVYDNNINYGYNNEMDLNNENNYNNINNNNMNDYNDMNNINNINNNNINEDNEEHLNNAQNDEDEIIMNKNNNNQFTFNQNYNNINNLNVDAQNENKTVLRGRPNELKSEKTKLKNNRLSQNSNNNNNMNYNNNYENDENNILNKYEDNSNIPEEEEIEMQNNNENNINDKNINESEDIRLNYVMEKLGLESLIGVFESYHMSFNDVLFLTKDDLNELGFKIYQKNRLISFIEEYTSKAKNFTLDEIKEFFEENNIYNLTNNQE